MISVSGQKDPLVKLIREIQTAEGRVQHSCYFAEGEELVQRACSYGGKVHSLLLTDRFAASEAGVKITELARALGAECFVCSSGLLSKILDAKPVPECLIVVDRVLTDLQHAFTGSGFVFMIEACENSDNLGMLLRCADATGVDSVVLAGNGVEPFNRKTVRGSRGAVFTVPICIEPNVQAVLAAAHTANYRVIASSANCETLHTAVDMTDPTVIVVGNEHTGISESVRTGSDAVIRIPMFGKINSLNIATAASVMLYEYIRQRDL